jgi:hypothetical protein
MKEQHKPELLFCSTRPKEVMELVQKYINRSLLGIQLICDGYNIMYIGRLSNYAANDLRMYALGCFDTLLSKE